uniref:Uncharacterized protein n=1 Tax=Anguilla anguilla TaxID=7936 RepID=A0A0E9Q0R1_ANGAN
MEDEKASEMRVKTISRTDSQRTLGSVPMKVQLHHCPSGTLEVCKPICNNKNPEQRVLLSNTC